MIPHWQRILVLGVLVAVSVAEPLLLGYPPVVTLLCVLILAFIGMGSQFAITFRSGGLWCRTLLHAGVTTTLGLVGLGSVIVMTLAAQPRVPVIVHLLSVCVTAILSFSLQGALYQEMHYKQVTK